MWDDKVSTVSNILKYLDTLFQKMRMKKKTSLSYNMWLLLSYMQILSWSKLKYMHTYMRKQAGYNQCFSTVQSLTWSILFNFLGLQSPYTSLTQWSILYPFPTSPNDNETAIFKWKVTNERKNNITTSRIFKNLIALAAAKSESEVGKLSMFV